MFQGFEWYVPADKQHWKRLETLVPILGKLGINTLWIPPACKAFGPDSIGQSLVPSENGRRQRSWGHTLNHNRL